MASTQNMHYRQHIYTTHMYTDIIYYSCFWNVYCKINCLPDDLCTMKSHLLLHFKFIRCRSFTLEYTWILISSMFANYTARGKWQLEKKNHDPASKLVAYALAQSFSHASHWSGHDSVSNCRRYGHGWAAILWPLRLKDLCDGTLSGQLARAWACEPEVDDGALYLSLCTLSVSIMQSAV